MAYHYLAIACVAALAVGTEAAATPNADKFLKAGREDQSPLIRDWLSDIPQVPQKISDLPGVPQVPTDSLAGELSADLHDIGSTKQQLADKSEQEQKDQEKALFKAMNDANDLMKAAKVAVSSPTPVGGALHFQSEGVAPASATAEVSAGVQVVKAANQVHLSKVVEETPSLKNAEAAELQQAQSDQEAKELAYTKAAGYATSAESLLAAQEKESLLHSHDMEVAQERQAEVAARVETAEAQTLIAQGLLSEAQRASNAGSIKQGLAREAKSQAEAHQEEKTNAKRQAEWALTKLNNKAKIVQKELDAATSKATSAAAKSVKLSKALNHAKKEYKVVNGKTTALEKVAMQAQNEAAEADKAKKEAAEKLVDARKASDEADASVAASREALGKRKEELEDIARNE